MKYKCGDRFLIEMEIVAIKKDRGMAPYLLMPGGGWYSSAALDDLKKMRCSDCKWKGKRYQRCSCCIRNRNMKDNYRADDPDA